MKSNIQPLKIRVYQYSNAIEIDEKCSKKYSLPKIIPNSSNKIHKLSFNSFVPIHEPFVISLFQLLVNNLEMKLSELHLLKNSSITKMRKIKIEDNARILFELTEKEALKRLNFDIIYSFNLVEQFYLLQSILQLFYPALIHFTNGDLLPIINSTLYDYTMRPNTKFQTIVKNTMLRCSRTVIDTTAFLMIHFFHAWESSALSVDSKRKLIQYFGHLMVSFECRPELIDVIDNTPEAYFFGIILETTSISFWNNLSNHRILEAFNVLNRNEKSMRHEMRKSVMFPDINKLFNHNSPIIKVPIQSFFPENIFNYGEPTELVSVDSPSVNSQSSSGTSDQDISYKKRNTSTY